MIHIVGEIQRQVGLPVHTGCAAQRVAFLASARTIRSDDTNGTSLSEPLIRLRLVNSGFPDYLVLIPRGSRLGLCFPAVPATNKINMIGYCPRKPGCDKPEIIS